MTCENNKKGCNNKILIRTLMLASMVCMLSVSDMLGSCPPPQRIDPNEAMEKIKKTLGGLTMFNEIFEGHENLIKRNCCGCCIDIENTMLPKKGEENNNKVDNCCLADYIRSRFILNNEGKVEVDTKFPENVATCDVLDTLIVSIYNKPSAS